MLSELQRKLQFKLQQLPLSQNISEIQEILAMHTNKLPCPDYFETRVYITVHTQEGQVYILAAQCAKQLSR